MYKSYKFRIYPNIEQEIKLSDRIYKCDSCWNEIDRDYNASLNIRNFAYKT